MSFFSNITGLFDKGGRSVLGIDVGSSAIKVVQLRQKAGRAVLETYGTLSLGPYGGVEIGRATSLPAAKIIEAVNDLLKEAKTTTRSCGLSIPVSSSLVTFIKLPAVSDKQLAQMVPIEARKYVPVPISEVTIDWLVIPKDETMSSENESAPKPSSGEMQTLDILLVVIHNDALTKNREITAGATLDSSFFEIETFSTIRAVLDQGIAPVAVLDIGAASSKLYVVERGVLKNSHTVSRGSQDITLAISRSLGVSVDDAERMKRNQGLTHNQTEKSIADICTLTLDYIFDEVKKSIVNYEQRFGQPVSRLVLSGGGSLLVGIKDFAERKLSLDVELADSFAKIETPAFLTNVLATSGPEFATAIGLALRKLQEGQ
ncbi:MAG: hypothetical protein RLZZ347_346 [Candidatus Parcubacteria bacterium]|jgi:type IV pilus assembly protein PilM